ncbi:MAG: glycosyltransferase, partial [Prevotellamassilia sp.]|nr:glycosyltransferase [Prevotellamassilia sp.]
MKITHIINALETGGAERLLTDMLPLMQAAGHEVNIVLLKSTNDVFEQKLKQLGIRVEAVNICAGRYNPLNAFKLAKYIKNSDIVHTHLFPSQYWGALAVKLWRKRIKLFTTEHSTFNSRGKYAITSWLDKHMYALYDGIICISKGTADFVKQRVPQNVAIRVIENGVRLPSVST